MTEQECDAVALRVVQAGGRYGVAAGDVGLALYLQDVRFRGYRRTDREALGLTVVGRLLEQGLVQVSDRNRFLAIEDTAAMPSGRVEAAVCA